MRVRFVVVHFPRSRLTGPSTALGSCSLAFEPREFLFQRCGQRVLSGLAVQVVELVRVLYQVEQLPLILFPEVDQLVRAGAYAVARPRVVVSRVVIVAVLHRRAPINRRSAAQQRQQAASLRVR